MTKKQNKALCEKYPFLIPSNVWTGTRSTDSVKTHEKESQFDWEYTWLDDMPDGWRVAFGEQLCAELKAALEEAGIVEQYRIVQIKEKYGSLRWYDRGNTEKGYQVIAKYQEQSERTCICCGKPATVITLDWISPYCDVCVPKGSPTMSVNDSKEKPGEKQ